MDLRELLGCIVVMLTGLCLLHLNWIGFRKMGMVLIWLASGLAAYFITGSATMACLMLLAWVCFPLWEMVFVLRQLRVPRHRVLADARPPREDFDDLTELSDSLVELGFAQIDQCKLTPAQHDQFYRIFLRPDGLTQAVVGYVAQGAIGFHFVALTSVSRDGRRWVTWDYPLTYGLVMPPDMAVYRALHCETVAELHQAHLDFLEINGIKPEEIVPVEQTPEAARGRLEQTLNQQIEYNITHGYLTPATSAGPENFCYSWRGTLYVAGRVLRDLLF
jgi:hypothetical protein